jgi:arabinogalactan endo-1,4-beta-galactosidase
MPFATTILAIVSSVSSFVAPARAETPVFANGADVGWLTQLESFGYTYEDETRTKMDALQILKNHGINSIRIRTFVNPTISSTALGVGNNGQAGSIALARRADAMGFRIMIDFHYSDTWAGPEHQYIPAAWASDSFTQLENHVYNYTLSFMQALGASGIYPEWVQVGNEIDRGMLLPMGSTSHPMQLAYLINCGYNAVKAVSPSTKVIVHLSGAGDLGHLETFFDALLPYGVHFDVIGASYYDGPGTVSTAAFNLRTLASRYNKPVMICEIGYSSSDWSGSYDDLKSIIRALKNLPANAGLGVFYWEPEAPEDTTTKHYGLGAVSPVGNKLEQFTRAIDPYLLDYTSSNQVINPDFANGLNGWQITSNANYDSVHTSYASGPGSGYELTFWKATPYQTTVWQTPTSLPNGTYTLIARVQNGGGENSATMFAWPDSGSETSVNLPVASTWTEVQIRDIQVTNGSVFLGFTVNANAENWVKVACIQLTKN